MGNGSTYRGGRGFCPANNYRLGCTDHCRLGFSRRAPSLISSLAQWDMGLYFYGSYQSSFPGSEASTKRYITSCVNPNLSLSVT